ncbi:MAG: TonB family protein [Myxococcales bacterium]|nr:TonB family protein [Myxococcales bacterium]
MRRTLAQLRRALLLSVLAAAPAHAFEETVRREEVDAGVHVPVLTRAPELLGDARAEYPKDAFDAGLQAEVGLRLTIDETGQVSEAAVTRSAGHGFDEAAAEAVRRFRFRPAEVDGRPATVQMDYVYHFVLEKPPEPPPLPATATLKGELVARGSRNRIGAATVRCGDDPSLPETVSSEDGRFELTVPAGECRVKVVANGFHLYETAEQLSPGETTEVVYHLLPKAAGFETVVRGTREKKEVVRRTLERQELQKIPGSFGDPVRVLQNFPGVARAPFISGALIVRGASPDQTLTFLDGVEVPILYHLGGGPSVVNGEFLDRIDFFPGGFGAHYGRAVGGIVDVATRKGASDTFHGVAKVDLQDSSLFFEAPIVPGVSLAAAARRSYIDALIPLLLPKDPEGGTLMVLPRYWDYQVRLDVGERRREEPSSGGRSSYYLMAFGSDDVLKVVATGGGRNRDVNLDIHTLFHRVVGNWTYRKGGLSFTLTPYLGYDLGAANFGVSSVRADEYEVGLREDLSLELTGWLTARAGVDLLWDHLRGEAEIPFIGDTQYVDFPGADPQASMQRISRDIDSYDGAVFSELDIKSGPLTVTPGLRASHAFLSGQTRWAFEPRLFLRFAATEATTVKGSVGLYAQPPDVTDMEEPPFGNPGLTHEKALQTSLGVEQKLTDVIQLDLTGYFNRRFENVSSPGRIYANEDGSVTRERFSNQGLGRAYGLELLLRHDVTREFFGWIAYTLNRSESSRVGQDKYFVSSNDQTHILTAVGSYRLPWSFELGARFRFVTGRPKTPLDHRYDLYNADSNAFSGTFGEFRSARFRDFHQLDLRLDRSWLFESWTLTAYLDVQNVYYAQNVEATWFDYRYREEVEVPGIPILPIVGVRGSF